MGGGPARSCFMLLTGYQLSWWQLVGSRHRGIMPYRSTKEGRIYLKSIRCVVGSESMGIQISACHAHCSVPQHLFSIEGKRCISLRQVDDNLIEGEPYNCLSHIHTCIKEKTKYSSAKFHFACKNQGTILKTCKG